MRWLRRLVWTLVISLAISGLAFGGLYWWISHPTRAPLPLPAGLVALDSSAGQELLAAVAAADHPALERAYQAQEKRSWCGVASAVMTLSALRGVKMEQAALFEAPAAAAVRSRWQVTFGGMSLATLARLLQAHGVQATAHHADEGLAAFRAAVRANAADAGDFMIVNWRRDVIGEEGQVGHLSPISAYEPTSDQVLILDVAAHVYPKTWVPLPLLFAAMDTVDGDGGLRRGWVEVR